MGHLNIVLLLLQNGASPDIRNIVSTREAISVAACRCHSDTNSCTNQNMTVIHQTNVSAHQRGETALHMAARAGQMEVVRCLLRNGALVDAMARVSSLILSINRLICTLYVHAMSLF